MTPDARIAAAIDVLDACLSGSSAEHTLTNWARRNRYAGSGDRAALRDLVFDAIRCKRSFAWRSNSQSGRGLMLGRAHAMGEDLDLAFSGQGYGPPQPTEAERVAIDIDTAPLPVRYDCPDWLWPELQRGLGDDLTAVLEIMQTRAPVFLRSNTARASREAAIASLAQDTIEARPHPLGPTVIEVTSNPRRVRNAAAYRDGMVEFQDAASQAVTDLLAEACPDGDILDYCAGGGGKALALAARGSYRVVAHDADPNRMKDIPVRAERAGAKITVTQAPQGRFDAVLCDVPCSGSGAWRRQPEAKWALTPKRLAELNALQDSILQQATAFVAPRGILAYATCSMLPSENVERIESFLKKNANWRLKVQKKFTPLDGGDGFFIAGLIRQD